MNAEIDVLDNYSTAKPGGHCGIVGHGHPASPIMGDPEAISVLAALGHQVRLKLWRLLLPQGSAGLSAGTIAARMSIMPSSLSFHLRQMTEAGILIQRRSSRHIIYAVNAELVVGLAELFAALSCQASTGSH